MIDTQENPLKCLFFIQSGVWLSALLSINSQSAGRFVGSAPKAEWPCETRTQTGSRKRMCSVWRPVRSGAPLWDFPIFLLAHPVTAPQRDLHVFIQTHKCPSLLLLLGASLTRSSGLPVTSFRSRSVQTD